MAACWAGYVLYCIAHHGSHRWRFRSRWLRNMRRRHLIHHARVRYNLGFTMALGDRVFGTYLAGDLSLDHQLAKRKANREGVTESLTS